MRRQFKYYIRASVKCFKAAQTDFRWTSWVFPESWQDPIIWSRSHNLVDGQCFLYLSSPLPHGKFSPPKSHQWESETKSVRERFPRSCERLFSVLGYCIIGGLSRHKQPRLKSCKITGPNPDCSLIRASVFSVLHCLELSCPTELAIPAVSTQESTLLWI